MEKRERESSLIVEFFSDINFNNNKKTEKITL
jgi:hypothetical protein